MAIDLNKLVELLLLLLHKEAGTNNQPAPLPVPPLPVPVPPAVPASLPMPTMVTIALAGVLGPRRNGCPPVGYALLGGGSDTDKVIVRTDGPTALDDKSLLRFDAEIFDADENGIRLEDRPDLLGCVEFVAEDAATGEELGAIGGAPGVSDDQIPRSENGVGFSGDRYVNSQRMSCEANLKRKGGPIKIFARLKGIPGVNARSAVSFTSPEIR